MSLAHAGFVAFGGRGVAGLVLCASALLVAPAAGAQAAPNHYRSSTYYAAHGVETAALLAGSALLGTATSTLGPGADPTWFPGDASLRMQRNEAARAQSDALLAVTVGLPVALTASDGRGQAHVVNSELIYAETLSLNLWLNSVVKVVAHRPRPYTYSARRDGDDPSDFNVSFYSGHASSAFAAASAGAYLYSEGARYQTSRLMVWGVEFMFAAATANLRTRAGKHYYSDVVVGALVGTTLGVGVPLLHGGERRPGPTEFVAALVGTTLGATLHQFAHLTPDDPNIPAFHYSPLLAPNALGLQAVRVF